MAISNQQQNFISELMDWSEAQLKLRDKNRNLVARWNLNGVLGKLTDEDVQAIFPHLDVEKITNAVTALQAVDTALGDDSSGQASNLIKLKG